MKQIKHTQIILATLLGVGLLFSILLITVESKSVNKCTLICRDGSKVSCEGDNVSTFKEKEDEGCKCDDEIVRCSDNLNKNENTQSNANNKKSNKNASNKNSNN